MTATRLVMDCAIARNDEVSAGQYRMRLRAPEMAQVSRAGQFCMIRVAEGLSPFLRRPM